MTISSNVKMIKCKKPEHIAQALLFGFTGRLRNRNSVFCSSAVSCLNSASCLSFADFWMSSADS
jgi:hypothetical protein